MIIQQVPRTLQDPGPPPTPQKTLTRWNQFLGSISTGMLLQDAMLKHFMTRADIEACCLVPEERKRWNDARLAARKRTWSALDFEDIFQRIAAGEKVKDAIDAVRGTVGNSTTDFMAIILADAALNEQYMTALKSRAIKLGEELIDIADDDSRDTLVNDKGPLPNNAAVNRDKLRVETRQRLMGSWFPKLFGDQKNQMQVNVQVNYAERLEAARARAKGQRAAITKAPDPAVVEAAFRELPAAETDTSWLDEKPKEDPLDTTWLEG